MFYLQEDLYVNIRRYSNSEVLILAICRVVLTLSILNTSFCGKNKPFFLKNTSNMTHEFLYDNFRKKILMLELSYKYSCVKFDVSLKRNGSFFSSK